MADLSSDIETNAQGPKRITIDGQSVTQHGLKDQIEADRYGKANTATRSAGRGIQITKLSPPGAV